MNLLSKLKETLVSVVPIMVIVVILHFTVAPLPMDMFWSFLIGGALLTLGLSIFLLGADIGMVPVGEHVGSALTQRKNMPLMLVLGFLIGFVITIAEPDVQVLATQVNGVDSSISPRFLVVMIAIGVGSFVSLGLARIMLRINMRWILLAGYLILFVCAFFTNPEFVGIGFDAGGATTGPMTVPFILALGMGVAAVRRHSSSEDASDESFGLVGIASIGPILTVLIMGIISAGNEPAAVGSAAAQATTLGHFWALVPSVLMHVAISLAPLVVMFIIFQFTLLHGPRVQVRRVTMGIIYTFIGLALFLIGVEGGFMPAARMVGMAVGKLSNGWWLVPLGLVLGATVVCAEPAVWVLTEQVERVSGGHIRRSVMLGSLAVGVSVAVGLAMLRVVVGFSIWWYLIPGYTIALALTFFCPPLFTAIAFDSGGVASGPMSSTFILSLVLGSSVILGGNVVLDAFGVVAMIAMTPLIAIQVLGLLYQHAQRKMEHEATKTGRVGNDV